ncbi:hypothetical protein, partial [Salinihabitans flavidus]|uniref:hypothetical protein n=1 Tax=Salinihabitans flavidus TaxID=569882 RepID=UPI001C3165E2
SSRGRHFPDWLPMGHKSAQNGGFTCAPMSRDFFEYRKILVYLLKLKGFVEQPFDLVWCSVCFPTLP